MIIEIPFFKGRIPKVPTRDLPIENAQTTDNADLSRGTLKAFYDLGAEATLNTTAWRSIFPVKSGATTFWATSIYEANFVNVPVYSAAGRFIYTDGVRGKESNYALASDSGANSYGAPDTTYYLGMPKPEAAITATVRGTGDGDVVDTTCYVYTYVSAWGYEGEPCNPSDVVDVEGDQYVELGNFTEPPSGYNISGIRIYRISTSSDDTDYQFVSEIHTGASTDYITWAEIVANSNIWDDKNSEDELTGASLLGEVITCDIYIEPPADLKGLLALPNGVVAAYRDKEIYLSEPYIHYGFPDEYLLKTHFDIKSIGYYDTTIVVGTEGYPYLINGYDPLSVSIEKLPYQQSCLFSRAMVSGPNYVLYPSPDGLCVVSGSGISLLTKNLFTKEQWADILTTTTAYDKTIIAFFYDNKYYAFYSGSNTGFIINPEDENQYYATFELTTGYAVYGGYVDIEDDTLYLLIKSGSTYYIKDWEGAETRLTYEWKSKVFVTQSDSFFSCMKVNGNFSSDTSGSGTITTTGTAVVGDGTGFTAYKAGYAIYSNSLKEYREISSITDATHMTLVSAFSSNLSAGTFKYNSTLVNIYKDDSLFFTRALNTTDAFRIPSGLGSEWEIEFKGGNEIYTHPRIAQAMDELL
jgi:hypothetical protein